jgi:hypothetical protein
MNTLRRLPTESGTRLLPDGLQGFGSGRAERQTGNVISKRRIRVHGANLVCRYMQIESSQDRAKTTGL